MKYVHGQIIAFGLRAMYQHAEVVSGAYKLRRLQVGINEEDIEKYREAGLLVEPEGDSLPRWRNLTDEEKLRASLDTMKRHIEFVHDCIEHLEVMDALEGSE